MPSSLLLRRTLRSAAVSIAAGLAVAGPAAAHGGSHDDPASKTAGRGAIQLRGCWMTVALVPRPSTVLEAALLAPGTPAVTAYGDDPMVAIWTLACDRARVGHRRAGRTIVSLVGVPVEQPGGEERLLANDFSHAVVRADTQQPIVAAAMRSAGIRVGLSRGMRYRHSRPGSVPSTAAVIVPGQYRLDVSARSLDQPHDHLNRFRGAGGRTIRLTTTGANDRFCVAAAGDCAAQLAVPSRSALARVLGRPAAQPVIGFDHLRLRRVNLGLERSAARR